MLNKIKYLDKLPPKNKRYITVPKRSINGVTYPAKTIERVFRRKIICSGPPMNLIDSKMRKKYKRKAGIPVVKYYEVETQ